MKNTYICRKCWETKRKIVTLFVGEQNKPHHSGFVYCEYCEDYDTHFNLNEEIEKTENSINYLKIVLEKYKKQLNEMALLWGHHND